MRTLSAIIGALLAGAIITLTFTSSGVDIKFFINIVGLCIVIGGSLSAIFLSYSLKDVMRVFSVISSIFLRKRGQGGYKKDEPESRFVFLRGVLCVLQSYLAIPSAIALAISSRYLPDLSR